MGRGSHTSTKFNFGKILGKTKRTRLSGLSASLLVGEAAEFLHLPLGPGHQLTKELKAFEVIYYYSEASKFMD